MNVLGITGASGSGKTTLLRAAQRRGALAIDCDAVYHRLLREDASLRAAIAARFPEAVCGEELNRKKLGTMVFASPQALAALNGLTHSAVAAEVRRQLKLAQDSAPFAAIDAIGLFESGLNRLCRATVAVCAPEQARLQRLMAREGISEEYARSRLRAQKSDAEFSTVCDYTLCNDCATEEDFLLCCDALLDEILY